MLKRFAIILALIAILGGSFSSITAEGPSTPSAPATTSSLLVKFVTGLSPAQQAAVIARNGGIKKASTAALRLHVIEVPSAALSHILQRYKADPQVENAEENKTRHVEAAPSDPLYNQQWALSKIGWDTVYDALSSGQITLTNTATVAILDTGIDGSHPDLHGNAESNGFRGW